MGCFSLFSNRKDSELTDTRLTELAEEMQHLALEPAKDNRAPWESWQDRYMLLQIQIAHEELRQFTRIANTLQAMQIDSVAELIGLQRQIDALSLKLGNLETVIDADILTPAVKRLKGEIKQYSEEEIQEAQAALPEQEIQKMERPFKSSEYDDIPF